ncbi:Uncharacterised protein [Vibrio cholerae]|nr:Uncharacterised protein [Vibrio cholerae]
MGSDRYRSLYQSVLDLEWSDKAQVSPSSRH